tara:strand:- start:196 stop:483 length:288 start_codon:yes stop_codon:yes gene_type:complete
VGRQRQDKESAMKIGDLVTWRQSSFLSDDYGVVVDISEVDYGEDQYDSGSAVVTVIWNNAQKNKMKWRIRAHYLEVIKYYGQEWRKATTDLGEDS